MEVKSTSDLSKTANRTTSQSVAWFSEGQAISVEIGGFEVVVKLIGRKGRRSRIAIAAPAGASFSGPGVKTDS